MKRRAYLLAGRVVTPLTLIGLKIFTAVTGRERVRVFVTNEKNEVLLLKGVISHRRWTLPGGGMNRNETAVAAARRELHEETGILAPESAFKYIRTLSKPEINIPFRAPLFRITVHKDELPQKMVNPLEVTTLDWFDRHNLPSPLSQIAQFVLKEIHD
ncbi:MAG: ADP-ribose pyrophosphatase [Candidatus Saccharibacteria bacterium]|nr:ADP-ribose pyrophosphatase [Candidatus Saccharibacteria bacterium]